MTQKKDSIETIPVEPGVTNERLEMTAAAQADGVDTFVSDDLAERAVDRITDALHNHIEAESLTVEQTQALVDSIVEDVRGRLQGFVEIVEDDHSGDRREA